MYDLNEVAARYLGSQSIEDFLISGGDPYKYTHEVFNGGVFGYDNPAAPDIGIVDRDDLVQALVALCESADIDAHASVTVKDGRISYELREGNPFSQRCHNVLLTGYEPVADDTQHYHTWQDQVEQLLARVGYDPISTLFKRPWFKHGNRWLIYLERDPGRV